jgi:hypothetical protein
VLFFKFSILKKFDCNSWFRELLTFTINTPGKNLSPADRAALGELFEKFPFLHIAAGDSKSKQTIIKPIRTPDEMNFNIFPPKILGCDDFRIN